MRRSLSGSMIGGIAETQEMLDFCAEHDVRPEIEVIQPRLHQRGLRARARQRRAVPLRHRYRVAAELDREVADAGERPPGRGQLGGDALDVLRARVVM